SGDESVAESFELRVVACRDHGSNEQGTAHALATAANETLTTPLPGLTGPRCESDKSRDLSTIERTEFRQFGDQGAGDAFSNARHGPQQFPRLPRALAKARTCAGLTTTTGRPAPARPAATTASKPPVASIATRAGDRSFSRATRSSIPAAVRLKANSRRSDAPPRRADPSIHRCPPPSHPSDPILAQTGFYRGPSDCSGSMERQGGHALPCGLCSP